MNTFTMELDTDWEMDDETMKLAIEDMHKRAQNVDQKIKELKDQGHTCLFIRESYPPQISWCQKPACEGRK